jgi:DUF1009 family protein
MRQAGSKIAAMPLGLIAGNGTFPFLILRAARQLGHDVVVVAVEGEAFPELEILARELGGVQYSWVPLGHLGTCIKTLKRAGVARAIMAGQVKHTKLFGGVMPDMTLLKVLTRLTSKSTDSLIAGIAGVLQEHGITLMDSTELLADLLARPGVLTRTNPTDSMKADFAFGYQVADAVAGLDIGQRGCCARASRVSPGATPRARPSSRRARRWKRCRCRSTWRRPTTASRSSLPTGRSVTQRRLACRRSASPRRHASSTC